MNALVRLVAFLAILSPAHNALAGERTTTLEVDRMTCASFAALVKKSLSKVDGVTRTAVSLDTRTVTVVFDDAKASVAQLVAATGNAGFPARPTP